MPKFCEHSGVEIPEKSRGLSDEEKLIFLKGFLLGLKSKLQLEADRENIDWVIETLKLPPRAEI